MFELSFVDTGSDIITSHCAISFSFACDITWAWIVWMLPHFKKKNNREIPSNIIDIQIQIHTKLAILADDMAVNIANNTSIHHRRDIHRHNGIFSLFWIQKNINIPHLINAHIANIQTISFHTKLTSLAQISNIHRIITKIHIMNKNEIY